MNVLKKILNIILILVSIVLIILCADLLLNKTVKTSYDSLSSTDQTAINQITGVVNLFDDRYGNDDIWSESFNPLKKGYIITKTWGFMKGNSYAVNVDLSGNIFAQKIDMGEGYDGVTVYRLAFCTPQTLNLYFSGNENTVLHMNNEDLLSLKYSSNTVAQTGAESFEEGFVKSVFCDEVQTGDVPSSNVKINFSIDSDNIALTGLQYRIIDDLRNASNIEEIKELIAEYVTVREYQMLNFPELALQQEKIELVEGCPQYVSYCISREVNHNLTYFNRSASNDIDFYSAFYYVCTGQYSNDVQTYFDKTGNIYVGAALCEILDEKAIIPGWREILEGSSEENFISQYSLIKAYCASACQKYAHKTVEDIQREYNFEEIKSMANLLEENNSTSSAAEDTDK